MVSPTTDLDSACGFINVLSRDKTFMKPQAESKSVVGDTMIQSPDHIVLPAAKKSVDVNDQPADDPPGQSIGLHVDDQSNVDVHD